MMKRSKKWLAIAGAAIMVTGMAAFSACNNDNGGDKPDPTPQPEKVVTAYQFSAGYYELASFGMVFDMMMNLESDNTGTFYFYDQKTMKESPVEWKCEADRDGVETMSITYDNKTYEMYEGDNGSFTYEYEFEFGGGYHRIATITGSKTISYASVDAWKEYTTKRYEESLVPEEGEKTATYTFYGETVTQDSDGAAIENTAGEVFLYTDGTAKARTGYAAGGSIHADYTVEEGTWTQEGDVLTVILAGNSYTVTKTDGVFSFTWKTTQSKEGAVSCVVNVK